MDGSDTNSGTVDTPEGAWRTLGHAFSNIKGGDILYVGKGTYDTHGSTLRGIHGTPDRVTKIIAQNRWLAKLTETTDETKDSAVLQIEDCSYLEIDGFEVFDPIDTGVGITVRDRSHHVTVKNCYVHDCGCNGISSRTSDYILFENNVVRGNAKRNQWNCSGISIWHPIEFDQKPGYHIVIRGNVAYENECDLPFKPLGFDQPTDGNGIIIDDFRNTQGGGQEGGYKAAVLVENNLSFNNGGRGISVFKSDNVTLRNNTTFHNLRVISKYADFPGDMTLSNSKGSRLYNNLIVKNPGLPTKALRCYDNDGGHTLIFNNIIIGRKDFCEQELATSGNLEKPSDEQDFPKFLNPNYTVSFGSIEDFHSYFGLRPDSPAIDRGKNQDQIKKDLNNQSIKAPGERSGYWML
ncbi:hypothetical protein FGF1_09860 [Flavobacteriaceae bacterium GF1]